MCFLVNFAQDNLQHELIRLLYHDVNVDGLLSEDHSVAQEVRRGVG